MLSVLYFAPYVLWHQHAAAGKEFEENPLQSASFLPINKVKVQAVSPPHGFIKAIR